MDLRVRIFLEELINEMEVNCLSVNEKFLGTTISKGGMIR